MRNGYWVHVIHINIAWIVKDQTLENDSGGVQDPPSMLFAFKNGGYRVRNTLHRSMQSSSLKRPYAQQATALAVAPDTSSKHPRVEDMSQAPSTSRKRAGDGPASSERAPRHPRAPFGLKSHRSASSSPAYTGRNPHRDGKHKHNPIPNLEAPLHTREYIESSSTSQKPIKQQHREQPKSTLGNFASLASIKAPEYSSMLGFFTLETGNKVQIHRTTASLHLEPPVIGVGDSREKKESEMLAALSVLYQLHDRGILETPKKFSKAEVTTPSTTITLSNGSEATYEQARSFMDYYCRLYRFPKPDLSLTESRSRGQSSSWEALMTVNERRIGLGSGTNKKAAQISCYLDVTQYLEKCDPQLWTSFLEKSKTGEDLGLAPKVYLSISDSLDDQIRDLCQDIRSSSLYKNRPAKSRPSGVTSADLNSQRRVTSSAPYIPPVILAKKSETLSRQRAAYLEDPKMATMRTTRSSLPVYTRTEDVMSHIRDHDVTICMAATGSGKTTQVPQLILDSFIDKGEGAKCNIICTQPRRLAAISVADRVAKERGESLGKSVGYQVRFDSKLPEDHGSITFCTTGVFLKRMQSALLSEGSGSSQRSLDDVTHIVVDEVHERDVDTDLLLVVLKRLMADRKGRGKPIKVILMSATIDATLFQTYFAEENGQPVSVTEIPGRSYPVTKHFMDDFLPDLARKPESRWVFQDPAVQRYIMREVGPNALEAYGIRAPIQRNERDEDLELPYAFIALTISHVLQRTDSGHVLVFLPGWDEIMAVQRRIQTPEGSLGLNLNDTSKYSLHLLHSTIPLAEQQVIFEPPPEGVRRIILATNIAETSITIPDVVYVVDTGKIKEQRYDPERHMSSLVSAWVGSSNLNQRAGRAGRNRPGEYFGILSRQHAEQLHPYQTVEMKRVDLSNIVMHVKALDFPGMAVEEVLAATIEPPAAERVTAAMKDLHMVGALDEDNNLTALGRLLLQLPVDVQMGRLVLFGSFFRCLDQALTLAAILTNRDPFISPMHLKAESAEKKNDLTPRHYRSDPLATLQGYNRWWDLQSKGRYIEANRFCVDNFLAKPTMLMIQKIKGQLLQSLYRAGIINVSASGSVKANTSRGGPTTVPPELNVNGDSFPLLVALITVASQPNFAIRTGERTYRTIRDKATFIHPSSVNHIKRQPKQEGSEEKQLYAFAEKRQNVSVAGSSGSAQMYLMTTTKLDPLTYMLFGAYKLEVVQRGIECDGWLPVTGRHLDALDDIERLRTLMDACMLRVYEGIVHNQRRHNKKSLPILPREEEAESGDEESDTRDYSLSTGEMKELDLLTRDIVRILDSYSDERISAPSRQGSRASTPYGSPSFRSIRLPGSIGFSASGYSTPQHQYSSAFGSRPGTPSRLSSMIGNSRRF